MENKRKEKKKKVESDEEYSEEYSEDSDDGAPFDKEDNTKHQKMKQVTAKKVLDNRNPPVFTINKKYVNLINLEEESAPNTAAPVADKKMEDILNSKSTSNAVVTHHNDVLSVNTSAVLIPTAPNDNPSIPRAKLLGIVDLEHLFTMETKNKIGNLRELSTLNNHISKMQETTETMSDKIENLDLYLQQQNQAVEDIISELKLEAKDIYAHLVNHIDNLDKDLKKPFEEARNAKKKAEVDLNIQNLFSRLKSNPDFMKLMSISK